MANETEKITYAPRRMFGRRQIFTNEETVTAENIVDIVGQAYITHQMNRQDIQYLYNYYKGKTPGLYKTKEVRPEINHQISEGRANAIVAFKVGYTVGKPIQYISSSADESVSEVVSALNDMMRAENKVTKDRRLVEWQMICGTGYRLVLPKEKRGERIPFRMYTLNPMNTFVVYANDYTERPLVAVSYKTDENGVITFTAYTEDYVYKFKDGANKVFELIDENALGRLPIIEYPANSARLGAFEIVISLLDSVDNLDASRLDAVDQFVQSLMVLYNCDLEDGTTANTIRQAGMILLRNTGENKADVKIISESLNQTDNETLKTTFIHTINEIVGMPEQGNANTSDSSNNGAMYLKNGWQGAEMRAQDFEAMFEAPERDFLSLVSDICESQNSIAFDPYDIDIRFTRRNYEDVLSKAQTLTMLLQNDWVHPQKAYEASGLFVDSEEAYRMGNEFHETQATEAVEEVGNSNGQTFVEGYYR